GELLQRGAEPALPVHDVLAPQTAQQVVVLDRDLDALADVLPEPGIDRAGVAAAHHQVHAAAGEVLQHRVVLGDLHRVVGGDERGCGREDDVLRLRADVREGGGGGWGDERRVVVLADREDVQAHLLGELGLLDHGRQALVLGGNLPGRGIRGDVGDGEDSELHGGCSSYGCERGARPAIVQI